MNLHPSPVPQGLAELCQLRIEHLLSVSTAISGVLVSSRDGFEVAAALGRQASAAKIAAMSSSLLSVAEAMTQASGLGPNHNAVLEADGGRVILMEIPAAEPLILAAFCAGQASLGQVLWPIRECAQDIGRAIAQHSA